VAAIILNSISSLDYVTKESCEICARRSNVQLQAMIENVHMLYLAGYYSNIVFVKFSRHVGFFSSHNGCYKTRTTVKYRNMAGLRTASVTGK
jgi:hypothetical protein